MTLYSLAVRILLATILDAVALSAVASASSGVVLLTGDCRLFMSENDSAATADKRDGEQT